MASLAEELAGLSYGGIDAITARSASINATWERIHTLADERDANLKAAVERTPLLSPDNLLLYSCWITTFPFLSPDIIFILFPVLFPFIRGSLASLLCSSIQIPIRPR